MVSKPETGRCASKDVGPRRSGLGVLLIEEGNECQQGRWAPKGVDCEIPHWLGRRTNHFYGRGNLFLAYPFKNLEGKPEREGPKRTIFASGGLSPLHRPLGLIFRFS